MGAQNAIKHKSLQLFTDQMGWRGFDGFFFSKKLESTILTGPGDGGIRNKGTVLCLPNIE